MIIWFKRNDGQLFAAEEGSATFQMMSKSGEFDKVVETIETPDGEQIALTGKPELWKDESETQPQQPVLANAGETSDSGQNSPAKRSGSRSKNKAKNS